MMPNGHHAPADPTRPRRGVARAGTGAVRIASFLVLLPTVSVAAPIIERPNPPTTTITDAEVTATAEAPAPAAEPPAAAPAGPPTARALLERAVALAAGARIPERLQKMLLPQNGPCLSVGHATWGRLVNGVRLPELPGIRVRPKANYGTPETIAAIIYAAQKVRARFPGTHPLVVGDISRPRGGRFRPHKSHQSGRDADIGYYVRGDEPPKGLVTVGADSLDLPRTWTFIAALLEDDKVEYIFIDYALQRLLYRYARDVAGVSEADLKRYFAYPRGRRARTGIIRHARGHRDHMHVRFRSPIAVAAAKDPANEELLARAKKTPEMMTVRLTYKVKPGDTLTHIAKRYRVRVKDLRRWNRLRKGALLHPGQKIRILRERRLRPTPRGARGAGT